MFSWISRWKNGMNERLFALERKYSNLCCDYTNLRRQYRALELRFTDLQERQQRHRQALVSLKRDLMHHGVFITGGKDGK